VDALVYSYGGGGINVRFILYIYIPVTVYSCLFPSENHGWDLAGEGSQRHYIRRL
jgi:hypothetical protein